MNDKNLFWSIKNSGEILGWVWYLIVSTPDLCTLTYSNKFKSKGFLAFCLSTYDFSYLYTTLPHNLIKEKLTELMNKLLTERAHFIWLEMRTVPFFYF